MEKYELDFSKEDIGEMIEMIRVQQLKMNDESFAEAIGVTIKTLMSSEDGKGPHGINVMKKINEVFPNINVKLAVEFL